MKKGKRWMALLLSALLITGSVAGPVFASETDIEDRTAEAADVNIEDFASEEDAFADENVQEDPFGDALLEEGSESGEGGESVQEETVLSEEPEEAESSEEAPAFAEDSAQGEELEDYAQDEGFEDSALPEEPADSTMPDEIEAGSETQEEVSEEPQQVEIQIDFDKEKHTLAPDENLPSQDELFAEFVNTEFGISSGNRRLRKSTMGSRLTGIEQAIYNYVSDILPQIAEGTISSTVFEIPLEEIGVKTSWSAEELGVDAIVVGGQFSQEAVDAAYNRVANDDKAVVNALLADNPYLLYWFDKTEEWEVGYPSISSGYENGTEKIFFEGPITYSFSVSQEYAGDEVYTVDTSIGASVVMAAQNAFDIVESYSGFSDYDKLRGYMEAICDLASYNHAAADDPETPYGNPWQMIWVFDRDTDTEVVCEGYSKAFQYLCDRTDFDDDISCYSVSGMMGGGTGEGRHMWNIVTMDDGCNYLVDVTNCDDGSVGQGGRLFLTGTEGSVDQGYIFVIDDDNYVSYTYKQETIDLYTESILSLASANYSYTERHRIQNAEISLGETEYEYNGTPREPEVFAVYNGEQLIRDLDFSVEYLNNTNAGLATVIVNGMGDYSGTVEISFEISKAGQVILIPDEVFLTYPESGTIEASENVGELSFTSNDTSIAEVDNTGKVTPIKPGVVSIIITAAETDNYYEEIREMKVVVNKGVQTITASDLALTYPESGTIEVSGNEGGLSFTSSDTSVAEVDSSGKVTAKGAGTATISITAAETDKYNEAAKDITVTVAKGTQTITASDLSLDLPGEGTIEVSGNEGGLSFTSSDTSVAEVDASGKVTAKGPGTATITITAAATDDYNAATITITVTVAKPAQTITASDLSLTYPESGTIEVSGNEGELSFTSSDTSVAEVDASGKVTAKGAGTATITITAAATDDYNAATITITVTVAKAAQTIIASDLSLTYPKSGTIEVSGNVGELSFTSSDTSVAEVDTSGKVTAKGVGTATITITAAATDNYKETTKEITVTVAKGTQTITAPYELSLPYPESGTIEVSGNKGDLSFTSSDTSVAEVDASGKVTAKGVGTATITITAAATANYNEESKQVTVKVAKGTQTITASDLSLDLPGEGTIEVSGNKGDLSFTSSDTSVAEVDETGKVTAKGLGTVVITITAAATDNYEEAAKDITVTVAKPAQTITASDLSLTYPESGTIEVSGNKGDLSFTSSDTSVAEVDASGKVTARKAGTATITITAAATPDYRETEEKITVTIAKANQTITASNLSLTFPNKGKITVSGNKGTLSYTSSKTSVATVDASGNVTAKGAGSATITIKAAATSNYNAASKQITVKVAKAAQSITTKAKASSVAVGKTVAVTTTGAKGTVTYKTSDTGIATVNASTGLVTAKKVGTVKITATAAATANYNAASRTVTIKVVPAATTSLKAENLAKGIKVTWAKVTGANGYEIYRNNSRVKTITSGTTVTWTDTAANTNNTKYVYKVVAKASTGTSTLSKSLTTYKVTAPTNKSAVNTATRKAVLTWTRNASANGYQVQYSLTSNFSGAKTVTITKNATLTTTVSSLTKGKTYYTRVRAYKTVGSTKYYSNWSASRTVKISK